MGDSGQQASYAHCIRSTALNGFVFTSTRESKKTLKLIAWKPVREGWEVKILRIGDSGTQAGRITDNSVVASLASRYRILLTSAIRTWDGELKLISWGVQKDGFIRRVGDSGYHGKEASNINIDLMLHESAPLITAVRTEENKLKLISWTHP